MTNTEKFETHMGKGVANISLIKDKVGWELTVFLEKWIEDIVSMKKFDEIQLQIIRVGIIHPRLSKNKLKLLIGASSSKIFHLEEFSKKLEEHGLEVKVVSDVDYADGFPNRKISKWFSSNKKFKKLVSEFKPDVIFVDRTKHFALEACKTDIPVIVHLRGDHWSELIMARETLYKSTSGKIAINKWEEIGEECFKNSQLILPICDHLSKITKERYSGKPVETMYQAINPENWFHKSGMELKHPCVGILQSATIWEKTKEMKILPEVLEKMPNVHFYWAGDGVYRDEVLHC